MSETGSGQVQVGMHVGRGRVEYFVDMEDFIDVMVSRKERS